MERGFIQIYTGDGKGKTTAALGLALRAAGRGLKVFFGQFVKGMPYGEHKALERFSDLITVEQFGRECFIHRNPEPEDMEIARRGWVRCREILRSGDYSVIILDELGIALHYNLISLKEVQEFLDRKPEETEIILTGRKIPEELIERADLVTEMREIKHYYTRGISAREGIEY